MNRLEIISVLTRLKTSIDHLELEETSRRQLIDEWLNLMINPNECNDIQTLGISITPDKKSVSLFVDTTVPTALLTKQISIMERCEYSEREAGLLKDIANAIPNTVFSTRLSTTPTTQLTGWNICGKIPLNILQHTCKKNHDLNMFYDWAKSHDIAFTSRFSRTIGHSFYYSEIRVQLAGYSNKEKIQTGLTFFDLFGISVPPDAALAALLHTENKSSIGMDIKFSSAGVINIGFVMNHPEVGSLIQLCQSVEISDFTDIAAIQGLLGAAQPITAKTLQTEEGFNVAFEYRASSAY
ncbi:hypothetical protein ACFL2V_17170 [Pseudomonadota bacterium]